MPDLSPSSLLQKYWRTVMPLLLALATAVLYGQFLQNPIIFDDVPFFEVDYNGNQQVSNYHFSVLELRSLPYATLAWGKEWLGLGILHFRVENLLLHLAVVLALFFFLAALSGTMYSKNGTNESGAPIPAFLAALLFALHPVATYAAGYLVQRTIVMATLFSLLAMLAYLHGSTRDKPAWLWTSVLFYYLAAFSKEHAIMLPAVLLSLTVLLHEDWPKKLKEARAVFAALAGIACLVLLIKKGILGTVYEENAASMLAGFNPEHAYPLSVLTQSWLFFKYAALWALPNPAWMSIDIREPFAHSLFSIYLLAMAGFIAWGMVALRLLLKRGLPGLAGFALLFPWIMFLTEFSAVRIQEEFVLYRSYLWAAGAFCLLPAILAKCNARLAVFIPAAVALAMYPASMDRLATFSHPLLLWDDAEKLVREHPDLPGVNRVYFNRGTELSKLGKYDQAIADFRRALDLSPGYADVYGNMGATYFRMGDLPHALESLETAIRIIRQLGFPPNPHFIYGHALVLEKLGRTQEAETDYMLSCKLAKRGCDKLGHHPSPADNGH